MDTAVEGGFVSGASLHRAEMDEADTPQPQPTASSSKQTTLANFFEATQGSKPARQRREHKSATDKDCKRFVRCCRPVTHSVAYWM